MKAILYDSEKITPDLERRLAQTGAKVIQLTPNDRPFIADGGDIILDPRPGPSGRPVGPVLKTAATGKWRLWGAVTEWEGEDT